jgi:ribosome modulation factor
MQVAWSSGIFSTTALPISVFWATDSGTSAVSDADKLPDVHVEGMYARAKGRSVKACPYPKGSAQRATWIEGWREADALDEDRPEVDKRR